jgi:hypothetical protein
MHGWPFRYYGVRLLNVRPEHIRLAHLSLAWAFKRVFQVMAQLLKILSDIRSTWVGRLSHRIHPSFVAKIAEDVTTARDRRVDGSGNFALLGARREPERHAAAIIDSGSTDRLGFRIVLDYSGDAKVTSMLRKFTTSQEQPIRLMLPRAFVERFHADLNTAKR